MKNVTAVSMLLVVVGCGPDQPPCGTGTVRQGEQCVLIGSTEGLSCGTGTMRRNNECIPNLLTVCGTDTAPGGGDQCISALTCGTGTIRVGGQCAPAVVPVTCGAGTSLQGTECVAGASTGPVSTFVTSGSLHAAASLSSSSIVKRVVFTDLTQGNADGWAHAGANMIGSGRALHLTGYGYWSVGVTPVYLSIEDTATSSGTCSTTVYPASSPSYESEVYVNFLSWENGNPQRLACARQGTVKLERVTNAMGSLETRITLNAVFSDGSTVTDKIFVF